MWRRNNTALAVVLLLALTGCSSGDDNSASPEETAASADGTGAGTDTNMDPSSDSSQPANDQQATGDVGTFTDLDPNFDIGSLPDDFPPELLPDSFTAGMYTEFGDARSATFESPSTFDDIIAEYTDKMGEQPVVVEGEERLASWVTDVWAVTVIDTTPTLIGVAAVG